MEMCLQKAEEDPAKEKEAEQEIARAEADQLKRELVKLRERTDDLEMDLARAKNDNEELKDSTYDFGLLLLVFLSRFDRFWFLSVLLVS